MSKFKKFFGVAAVVAAAAGVIAYFMKKDRSVEPEFETPNDDEEFEQDLKDLFDDYKEEAPAAKATGEQPEETSTEAKSQPEENEKEETAEENSCNQDRKTGRSWRKRKLRNWRNLPRQRTKRKKSLWKLPRKSRNNHTESKNRDKAAPSEP